MDNENFKGWFGRIRKIVENKKPLEELIFDEKFEVISVRGKTTKTQNFISNYRTNELGDYVDHNDKPINVYSGDEHILGKDIEGGFTKYLELKVKPLNEDCIIKTITFEGDSPVLGGYTIIAKIPKYNEHIFSNVSISKNRIRQPYKSMFGKVLYTERPYKEEESALEISILNDKGQIIRTDEAAKF